MNWSVTPAVVVRRIRGWLGYTFWRVRISGHRASFAVWWKATESNGMTFGAVRGAVYPPSRIVSKWLAPLNGSSSYGLGRCGVSLHPRRQTTLC